MNVENIIITFAEKEPCYYSASVVIPKDIVRSLVSKIEKRYIHKVKIPGFRAGKTPLPLIRKRFFTDIQEDAHKELLKIGVEETINRCDRSIAFTPMIPGETLPEVQGNNPFSFSVEFDVSPEFDLPNYATELIINPYQKRSVSEKDIQGEIEILRDKMANYKKVDRPAQERDMVQVSYSSTSFADEDVPDSAKSLLHEEKNWMMILKDSEIIPGTNDKLCGMKSGESVSFEATFPEDNQDKFLAGKTVSYDMKLHEVHERVLPEVNDEFAQLVGKNTFDKELNDQEALLSTIKVYLEENENEKESFYFKNKVHDYLMTNTDFPLPPNVLEREKERSINLAITEWRREGNSIEAVKKDEKEKEKFRNFVEKRARESLKFTYIVTKIAKQENIKISEQDHRNIDLLVEGWVKKSPVRDDEKKEDIKDNLHMISLTARVLEKLIKNRTTKLRESQSDAIEEEKQLEGNL